VPDHGGIRSSDVCSCYVLMDSRGLPKSQVSSFGGRKEFIPACPRYACFMEFLKEPVYLSPRKAVHASDA
jgi:hypothetical protein